MADLDIATRELFIRTVKDQVFMRTPFIEELMKRSQVTYRGGKTLERLVDRDELTDQGQAYTANQALVDNKKDVLTKPSFSWKNYQQPMRYDVDEYANNILADNEEQLLDLAEHLVKKAQRGIKLALQRMVFNVNPKLGTGSETGVADNSAYFQSLLSGLDHGVTYGGLSRTLGGANGWWEGSDPEGRPDVVTTSSQNAAYNMTIANIRKFIIPIQEYMDSMGDILIVVCPSLYNKLRAEMQSYQIYNPVPDTMNFGFQKMVLDGMTVMSVPYLENGYGSSGTTENWMFLINLADWELRIHTARNFMQTPFVWQGEISNGFDFWLARILLRGNLVCWKPNGSMWLQNVS